MNDNVSEMTPSSELASNPVVAPDVGKRFYFNLPTGEQIYIGRAVAGWAFELMAYPSRQISGLRDWKNFLSEQEGEIEDEYGWPLTTEELLNRVTNRSAAETINNHYCHRSFRCTLEEFLTANSATLDENGLLHRAIDGTTCTKQLLTWDIILGE